MAYFDETDFIKKGGRTLYAYHCDHCGKKGYRRHDYISKVGRVYCSSKCKSADQKKGVVVQCATCGADTVKTPADMRRSPTLYCSRSCASSSNNRKHRRGKKHPNYVNGNSSYRKRALEHYEHVCSNEDCIITKQVGDIPVEMLDVDHIDEDRTNNHIDNLQLLCVWCHSLKTRNVELQVEIQETN